jgi:hypothetical protein
MDGRYFAKSQEGGAINAPKDGKVAQGSAVNAPKDGQAFTFTPPPVLKQTIATT